jgi:hypothetical protein
MGVKKNRRNSHSSEQSGASDSMAGDMVSIGALQSDPANARRHNPRNVGLIEEALQEVGAARSIVIDEDGVVLAGNATIEAAGNVGIEKVRIVEASGDEIIAVRRRGLTPRQKTRLALFDNRAAELADWGAEVMAGFARADEDLLATMWTASEIEALAAVEPVNDEDGGEGFNYRTQFGVIVICDDEPSQRSVFERLSAEGMNCRVVVT